MLLARLAAALSVSAFALLALAQVAFATPCPGFPLGC